MLQHDVKRLLRERLAELRARTGRGDWGELARRAFARLKLDGSVGALTPPSWEHRSILELASYEHRFRRVLGLDGGSTRPMHFANGVTICANQAVMVGSPPQEVRGLPLEAFRTVALVSHSFGESGGPRADYHEVEGGLLGLWQVHITKDYLGRREELDHIVKGLADSASEGRHALRLAELVQLGPEDLLILDGNIFPVGLYYYLVDEGARRWEVDLAAWEGAARILEQHLRLAEQLREQGVAYLGINKTPRTCYLIQCLDELEFGEEGEGEGEGEGGEEEVEIEVGEGSEPPWADDHQFIRALFSQIPKGHLGWTSWFLQRRYRKPPSWQEEFELFSALGLLRPKLPPEEYQVAYFFVYDPRRAASGGSVLKVETPHWVLNYHDPKELQRAILAELARGGGLPAVLRRADSQARITQREREALIELAGLPPDRSFSQDREQLW